MASPKNLFELLESTALRTPTKGIIAYSPGQTTKSPIRISYKTLLSSANENAKRLLQDNSLQQDSVILLHFDSHVDNMIWFWATIAAGMIPVICGPLPSNDSARRKHLLHLFQLLQNPLCLIRQESVSDFDCQDALNIITVERMEKSLLVSSEAVPLFTGYRTPNQIASLMLTSGSTGNAKAVPLRHGQILQAVLGKSIYHRTTSSDVFLNWIGLDHVANLTEIHLHALSLGADQVHIQATDLLVEPLEFIDFASRHSVSYSFAPNFFLAKLERVLTVLPQSYNADLSRFRVLISGGEANPVATVLALSRLLMHYGAPADVIRPGFGMTETCAGSIYSLDGPQYDIQCGFEFSSLGRPIPGIEMRITSAGSETETVASNEIGDLQVRGEVVFTEYYNNPVATENAFSKDGWFKTGDRAFIDGNDRLVLTGRTKDTVIINGVKHFSHEIETSIEEAALEGLRDGHTIVFPYRPENSATEVVCVMFLPSFAETDGLRRAQTTESIARIVTASIGSKPFEIVPLNEKLLQKSSLGKLSRTKIKNAYEKGEYDDLRRLHAEEIISFRRKAFEQLDPHLETDVASIIATMFDTSVQNMGAHTSIMDLGISSIELIRLKKRLQSHFRMVEDIPITKLITEPTVRGISSLIRQMTNGLTKRSATYYEPVVVLNKTGSKSPLWLIHPGVGEVLVFVPLAKYITDRPVYALRARGLDQQETSFTSISEAVEVYKAGIKRIQPRGPYIIAGYSYGAMLAFELSKSLLAEGKDVAFTGSFNLPPHIAFRMQQLDWHSVLLHLAYFIGLVDEAQADSIASFLRDLPSKAHAIDALMAVIDAVRMRDLDLSPKKLERWTDVAHNLQALARTYEPQGKLKNGIDVFVADPLRAVAPDRQTWIDCHLQRWTDFCENKGGNGVRLHQVNGNHYTMLAPENAEPFYRKLRKALSSRGV